MDLHRRRSGCRCRDLESTGNLLVSNHDNRMRGRYFNFQLRRNSSSGVYDVRSYHTGKGDYTLYAEEVAKPGSGNATTKCLKLDEPTLGAINPTSDVDHSRLDFTETT